mgnify:CR=1 FL=1
MSFWRGKRVMVTGASGFVGSHLAECLRDKGAVIIPLSHQCVHDRQGILEDIRDRAQITRIMAANRVELCFHLAAQAIGSIARQDPITTLETNVQGTWNVLEACRILKVPLILASSDKAYGNAPSPYTEDTPLEPAGIYETSKACADFLARSYVRAYGLSVAIARPSNLYGEGDRNFTRIVPYAISQALRGEPTVIWGTGQAQRDYLHINDMTSGYVMLAESLERLPPGSVFNFGTGRTVSVLGLVEFINSLVGVDIKPIIQGQDTGEIEVQSVDASKARRGLGWVPAITLEDGMERTVDWYKGFLNV